MPIATLSKSERLNRKKVMERMFAGGARSFSFFPLRVVYVPAPELEAPVAVLVSVSKRRFKRAVMRNRLKRQIREAYRLHKQILIDVLPADGPRQILRAAEAGAEFGCFHIAFDYHGPFMGCNTYFSNRRARRRHIAFGDQGIFLTRALFQAVGGFPDLPLMEDYELSRTLRRRGTALHVLPGTILTSGRRYREGGPLRTMAWMFWLRCLYRAGVDVHRIARLYRDVR